MGDLWKLSLQIPRAGVYREFARIFSYTTSFESPLRLPDSGVEVLNDAIHMGVLTSAPGDSFARGYSSLYPPVMKV